jgi:hypothetical protein
MPGTAASRRRCSKTVELNDSARFLLTKAGAARRSSMPRGGDRNPRSAQDALIFATKPDRARRIVDNSPRLNFAKTRSPDHQCQGGWSPNPADQVTSPPSLERLIPGIPASVAGPIGPKVSTVCSRTPRIVPAPAVGLPAGWDRPDERGETAEGGQYFPSWPSPVSTFRPGPARPQLDSRPGAPHAGTRTWTTPRPFGHPFRARRQLDAARRNHPGRRAPCGGAPGDGVKGAQ